MKDTFPNVTGKNLNKREINIPRDLEGELNILIVAFQQWQQFDVNTWVPFLDSLKETNNEFSYYELPTIRRMNWVFQRVIDGGMRGGIPSVDTREHTITLYIDKNPFKDALDIESENNIYLFLTDRRGLIYGRWKGQYEKESAEEIIDLINSIRISSTD